MCMWLYQADIEKRRFFSAFGIEALPSKILTVYAWPAEPSWRLQAPMIF